MRNLIGALLAEWLEKKLPSPIDREIDLIDFLNLKTLKIITVTGFRRVGKTYLLYCLIQKLLEEKNSRKNIVYFNFEDERIPLKTEFVSSLIPAIRQFFGNNLQVLFLDEVQNIPNWSKWLRRINDTESIKIFVSGSSSKMSSKEIPTELRGRFLEVKVFPLSFKEFLKFKQLEFNFENLKYSENQKALLLNALNEFLQFGGLPEIVLSEESKKFEIANTYYQTTVRRDIIERNKIKNEEALKALIALLLNSTQYSISKLYNNLKSANYAVGKTTIQKYLACIENSYFTISIPIFSYKIKNQLAYPKKIYFIDNIFINLFSTTFAKNYGRTYENIVALTLKRKLKNNEELHYWKSPNSEVDFVIQQNNIIIQLIQVCYDISDITTKNREIKALLQASKELKCNNLLIITQDHEAEEETSWFNIKRKISFTPLWKWLLQIE